VTTTRAVLTIFHRSQAIHLAEVGSTDHAEWVDEREPGLRIRVRGKTATWLLRFRSHTVTLGPATRWTPLQAREMASYVRGLLRCEIDPRPWIDARAAGATSNEASGVVLNRRAKETREWTIGVLMQRYLDDHIRLGRVVNAERRPPSAKTAKDVEFVIKAEPFSAVSGLFARQFDEVAFEDFRNAMADAHGGSASRKAVAYVRAAMSWARDHHASASGLVGAPIWWAAVKSTHVEKKKERMPSVADLGITLAIAQAMMKTKGSNRGISASVVAALHFVVLIVQRRAAIEIEWWHVVEDERAKDGSGILYLPPEAMKSRREHVLPLPPSVMDILRPAIATAKAEGSRWLFPSIRRGRAAADISIDASALNQLLRRLRGVDGASKKRGAVDLLSAAGVRVPTWSPHDVRRTFATVVEDATTRGDAVSAVLDHAQDGGTSSAQDAAAITRAAYSQAQRLPLKKIALDAWVTMLLDAVAAAEPIARDIVSQHWESSPARRMRTLG
jgi:hypothetical protein